MISPLTVVVIVLVVILIYCWFHAHVREREDGGAGIRDHYDAKEDRTLIEEVLKHETKAGEEISSVEFQTEFHDTSQITANVFIEFCYNKTIKLNKINFRKRKESVFKHVLNYVKMNKGKIGMFIYRGKLTGKLKPFEIIENVAISIDLTDNYGTIHVPKTKEEFAMDEYFTTSNGIAIQVEYSESGPSHKSNVFEFYLRNRFKIKEPAKRSKADLEVIHSAASPYVDPYPKREIDSFNDADISIIKAFQNVKKDQALVIDFPDGISFSDWDKNVITKYFAPAYYSDFSKNELGLSNTCDFYLINDSGELTVQSKIKSMKDSSSERYPKSPIPSKRRPGSDYDSEEF